MTDDNGACDFAVHRLGSGRVHDTIDLLREAVTYGDLDGDGALNVVNAIRDGGRSIRRVHPNKLERGYFK